MGKLGSGTTSSRLQYTHVVRDDFHFQIVSVAICLIISGAHMNILFIVKVAITYCQNEHPIEP